MRKMSEAEVQASVGRQCANGSVLVEDDIIDVSGLDFDDTDAWLYLPTQGSEKAAIHDLYTWLKTEPEFGSIPENTNRKCIDTRTFTRPKKRSSRMSFESIFEAISPSPMNVWRTQGANFTNVGENANKGPSIPNSHKEDGIPAMLKTATSNFLANEHLSMSGQESMEVFLNMSHSKGIDSFINLTEPGFSDPLMNVSQPSIFCSSITSLPRDDSLHSGDYEGEERPGDLSANHINETFSNLDLPNNSASPADRTFTNRRQTIDQMELNETYNADAASNTLILSGSDKDKSVSKLSSTFVNKECGDRTLPVHTGEKKDLVSLDATYFQSDMEQNEPAAMDATFSSLEPRNQNNHKDRTLTIESYKGKRDSLANMNCEKPSNFVEGNVPTANSLFATYDNALDSTFKYPIPRCNQSTPKSPDTLNSTFKSITKQLEQSRTYNSALCSNFKAPTSLRRELLAEIQRTGDRGLDSTYNHVNKEHISDKDKKENYDVIRDQNMRNDVPVENKYNTYKKESSLDRTRTKVEPIGNDTEACAQKIQQERKFYTFTKKTLNHAGKTDMENTMTLENVDSTFTKPFPKLQKRKQHIPRMLSKLPQFLQKSNPNLGSNSLKTVNVMGCANSVNVAYNGSQPNIVEKSLASRGRCLGKTKSGSEQRLLELNSNAGEFQMTAAGGSTESIESTQSAHSAPDLDDRLSTCSDSSHNSYTAQTMNIEQLHQIVRMQEESLKQESTPKLNRRVLENTWIETKKDLPSPIPKNGADCCETDSSSVNVDYNVKTSSPLLSPTGSSQSLNTDGHPMENILQEQHEVTAMNKIEITTKPTLKVENRTRLRQPTNWSTGIRPPNAMSAIPRPPSRIPGPRFTRPVAKSAQADVRRGFT